MRVASSRLSIDIIKLRETPLSLHESADLLKGLRCVDAQSSDIGWQSLEFYRSGRG